jgi:hypothetical protein
MTRAENWSLIQRLCEQAKDDSITAVRVALLNDFNKPEPFRPDNQIRHILASVKPFFFGGKDARPLETPITNLPLILFPYATGSNLLNLLPVAQEAKRRRLLGLVVGGHGVRPESLSDFENVITEHKLWQMARKGGVLRIFQSAGRKFKKLVDLLERLDGQCANRVRQNYGWIFRQLVASEAMQDCFRSLLADWQPSCIVSTSDYWPLEFQLYCQAKRLNIPTSMIQHGELTSVTCWPTYADTFLVWGSVFRDKLLELGAAAERLKVCGMPASDALFNRCQKTEIKSVNTASPACLVLSHAHDRFEEPGLFKIFGGFLDEAIRSNPRVAWKIKLHPAEDDSFYRELGLIGHKQTQVLPRDTTLDQAVEESDVVCTIRSTAGLQAMMMQRPLIVLDLIPGSESSVYWPLHGGGVAAKDSGSFKTVFDRLIDDDAFRAATLDLQSKFLDQSFANRGRAATEIVTYLENQTGRRSQTPLTADLAH